MIHSPCAPVILLAFANDREDRARYLRNLPEETRRLRDALTALAAMPITVVDATTPTPTPTGTPTPTNTPALDLTATVWAMETQLVRVLATQTAEAKATQAANCAFEPEGEFSDLWNKEKARLGCPEQTDPIGGLFAEQTFERGDMFWS